MEQQEKFYCVAGHRFRVSVPKGVGLDSVLPSYTPFETVLTNDSSLLFSASLEIVDEFSEVVGTRIGLFDSGTASYEVFLDEEGCYSFSILLPGIQGSKVAMLKAKQNFASIRVEVTTESRYLRFGLNNSLMVAYAFSSSSYSTLLVHSSVVVRGSNAYMFLGHSGAGKSTHSAMWMKAFDDSWLLNDDNPVMRMQEGKVFVYGSPWSGKTPCYKDKSAIVKAMVRIVQWPENQIERLDTLNTLGIFTSSISRLKWDKEISRQLFSTMERMMNVVPFYELKCTPDKDAALICNEMINSKNGKT